MIYELNGKLHFELSPDVMQELVCMANHRIEHRPASMPDSLLIGLSNFRSAFECELYRLKDAKEPEADPNADLCG